MTAPKRRLRRAGMPWRLLAHVARPRGENSTRDDRHDIRVAGTEFDELVVGRWLHIEQMGVGNWWMNIGGVTVHVWADRDGRPKEVMVHGPEDYDAPVEGCNYALDWTRSPS